MLAISLGTVYAFYPSIAPYSIIDYQYASVIELWILVISAIPTLIIAILDIPTIGYGPSGKEETETLSSYLSALNLSDLEVTHNDKTGDPGDKKVYHLHKEHDDVTNGTSGKECSASTSHEQSGTGPAQWHDYGTGTYSITNGDKYFDQQEKDIPLSITFKYYKNWFQNKKVSIAGVAGSETYTIDDDTGFDFRYWPCVWICAIFYILCIQIFMSMLHYPDSLLSSLFNNQYLIGFISVLFNTLRETMQACGFSGAGKQYINLNVSTATSIYKGASDVTINANTPNKIKQSSDTTTLSTGQIKLNLPASKKDGSDTPTSILFTDIKLKDGSDNLTLKILDVSSLNNKINAPIFNGTIASTNKLITLFVMMFCVFTGDGYLQHYRICCRDCWPTTGFTKGQSCRYWLHFGFKGGSKSFRMHLLLQ